MILYLEFSNIMEILCENFCFRLDYFFLIMRLKFVVKF